MGFRLVTWSIPKGGFCANLATFLKIRYEWSCFFFLIWSSKKDWKWNFSAFQKNSKIRTKLLEREKRRIWERKKKTPSEKKENFERVRRESSTFVAKLPVPFVFSASVFRPISIFCIPSSDESTVSSFITVSSGLTCVSVGFTDSKNGQFWFEPGDGCDESGLIS